MLDHLFTRVGSQFREGGLVHVKFVVAAGPVFAAKATRPGSFHKRLTLVKNGGTGLLKLTLDGGCREMALTGPPVYVNIADPTDVTDSLTLNVLSVTESTGVITMVSITGDGAEAAVDAATTDEIHFTLYVAK